MPSSILLALACLILAVPAHAFGAGNIASLSSVEGLNCEPPRAPSPASLTSRAPCTSPARRSPADLQGDIEDTLLALVVARAAGGKHFDKLAVARVYFGNWLRDYSQAIDVGECPLWQITLCTFHLY
jgi:hypothetical protein